jgi:hypothetical protein
MKKPTGGCLTGIAELVKIMLVRGSGIRDISAILRISVTKVLKVLTSGIGGDLQSMIGGA